jgi:hypothetical protein
MKKLLSSLLVLSGLSALSWAQGVPFTIRAQQGNQVASISNNGSVLFAAPGINRPVASRFTLTYRGAGVASFAVAPEVVGAPGFNVTQVGSFPVNLATGDSYTFEVTYLPSATSQVSAQASLNYRETLQPTTPNGSPIVLNNAITLNLIGTAPDLVISYFLADGNVVPLSNGSTLDFAQVPVNTVTSAIVSITNRGSATGTIQSLALTGETFQLFGLPLLPLSIESGRELRVTVRFTPRAVQEYTGRLALRLGDTDFNINIVGQGVGALVSYQLQLEGQEPTPIEPGVPVNLPEINLEESIIFNVIARNTGNFEAPLSAFSLTPGTGFGLLDAPPLPRTLLPGASFTYIIQYSAAQRPPGPARAILRIGNDVFTLAINVLAGRTTYTYTAGAGDITVPPGNAVNLPPVPLGQPSTITFRVRNSGTTPTSFTSISIPDGRGVFTLLDLPALPFQLQPQEAVEFRVRFQSSTGGFSSAALRIDNAVFPLTASATALGRLPSYRFTPTSSNVEILQQPVISLALTRAYSVDVFGQLNIAVDTETFNADPAVRFSTGGQVIGFTIPAGTTEAVFTTGSRSVRIQTGTVASDIIIIPTFRIANDVVPEEEERNQLRLSIPGIAPRLTSLRIGARSANDLVLQLSGITNTRSLTRLDLELTPAPGITLTSPRLTINLETESRLWFLTEGSRGFGGQVQINVPLNFRITGTTITAAEALAAISATITNERGTSNAINLPLL